MAAAHFLIGLQDSDLQQKKKKLKINLHNNGRASLLQTSNSFSGIILSPKKILKPKQKTTKLFAAECDLKPSALQRLFLMLLR